MISHDVLNSTHARHANRSKLATLLKDARTRTLALADAYEAALGAALPVPRIATLNPPLWELGHIAWFADHWLCPQSPRGFGAVATYDALYDSSLVAQSERFALSLPSLTQTRALLQNSLDSILKKLSAGQCTPDAESDEALYFYRLALFHEDMHAEAAIYSAKYLNIPIPEDILRKACAADRPAMLSLTMPSQKWLLGSNNSGFVFDNELGQHTVDLSAFEIDARTVTWAQYLPFVHATGRSLPSAVGSLNDAAQHISWFDAKAWCDWAGRRLPGEAEWECAAMTEPQFTWGEVWEWTDSRFAPYPNFKAHAYKEYSAPWFGTHQVLRGGSNATSVRMMHPKYRNFFMPDRTDIYAGFRSCKI